MDKVKDILTKYWVGILCGVIALIAIIANFFPLDGYHTALKGKLQGSANTYNQIDQLIKQQRLRPKMMDDLEQKELGMFPSAPVIEAGKRLVADLETESKNAMIAVVQINTHQPLVANVLPNPGGTSPFTFRDAYIKRLSGLEGTLAKDVLHAVMPPTPEQILAEEKRKWTEEYATQLIPNVNNPNEAANQQVIEAQFQTARVLLPTQMREAAAQGGKVYMAPTVLVMDPLVALKTGPAPNAQTIWWAQMGLWVQEDVANAIAHANRSSKNVMDARVKRLLALNVPISPLMIFTKVPLATPGTGMGVAGPEGAQVTPSNPNDLIVADYTKTPSGRMTNGLYDVVQYQVEMVIAAKELPAVLASFSDNRLITVLNIESIVAENSVLAANDGFMYGPDPVIRVVFRCESLFLREWSVKLMPEVIKKTMGIAPPPAPGT